MKKIIFTMAVITIIAIATFIISHRNPTYTASFTQGIQVDVNTENGQGDDYAIPAGDNCVLFPEEME